MNINVSLLVRLTYSLSATDGVSLEVTIPVVLVGGMVIVSVLVIITVCIAVRSRRKPAPLIIELKYVLHYYCQCVDCVSRVNYIVAKG